MQQQQVHFSNASTVFYFNASLARLKDLAQAENTFIITDTNLMKHYQEWLQPWNTIVIRAGEASKNMHTVDDIIHQLIALNADRNALIIGFGGGVVTDIAGFVAGIYKRGVRCGFIPASVLAMADAAVGGKNGLDAGSYKNMMGLIRQPEFLLYDYSLLSTLPHHEWINGFAEIIKHAAILDKQLFGMLQQYSLDTLKNDQELLSALIQRNVLLKAKMVQQDEFEAGERKLLNFGHTLGHAIENFSELPHGHAVAIGMTFAARLSEKITGFKQTGELTALIEQYQLPVDFLFDQAQTFKNMMTDKKRSGDKISYVLLEEIGKAVAIALTIEDIKCALQ